MGRFSIRECLVLVSSLTVVCSSLEISTPLGKIVGQDDRRTRNGRVIHSFTGIPYAKPPVGALRFKDPQSIEPWSHTLNATEDGPICAQVNIYNFKAGSEVSGQEDCLILNVYTPKAEPAAKLPVMVFIHGGGYMQGSSQADFYGPEYLLDREVVLVTFNYRLGPLGFLSLSDDPNDGNFGLKDQALVLKWVHDNIKSFGGNPDCVTVFGESAGGASVHYQIRAPVNKGFVHRGISISGTGDAPWAFIPLPVAKERFQALVTIVGCSAETMSDVNQCLLDLPVIDLLRAQKKFDQWLLSPTVIFGPVAYAESDIPSLISKGQKWEDSETNVPWINGISSGEGGLAASFLYAADNRFENELMKSPEWVLPMLLELRPALSYYQAIETSKKIKQFYFGDKPIDRNSSQSFINMMTDSWFLKTAVDSTIKYKGDTYFYYYDYEQSVSHNQVFGLGTVKGVSHSDMLLNVFPMSLLFPNRTLTKQDISVSNTVLDLWTNFAKCETSTGKPDLKWTPAAKEITGFKYMYIGGEGPIEKQDLLPERIKFWQQFPLQRKIKSLVRIAPPA